MEDFHVARFQHPPAFLQAVEPHDDSFMNYGIGSLLDFLKRFSTPALEEQCSVVLLAVYRRNDLLCVRAPIHITRLF